MKTIRNEREAQGAACAVTGEAYLTPEDAVDCVRLCEEHNVAVIGVEGFTVDEGSTVPLSTEIADLAVREDPDWSTYRGGANRDAEAFIRQLPRLVGIRVCLTLLSESEWLDSDSRRRS